MRVTNGSAVSTASTPPDLMMSIMVGNVTSTKLTPLGSTPFSTSHFTNRTCRNAFSPGAPTFLPTKSFGSLMVMPLRTKAVILPFDTGLITVAPAMATRSRPPSTACRNTVDVGPPIWIEFDRIAAGIFELMPTGVISTSSPCFLKMPSSIATIAEPQSEVAVQPTWILACAKAVPVSARLTARAATVTARAARTSFTTFSPRYIFVLFIYIFFYHIFHRKTRGHPVKLATFKSGGQQKIGIVHTGDTALFDLAAAASRNGSADPAFASMLALIDAGESALEQAAKVFEKHGKDESLSIATGTAEILAPVPEPRQMRDGMSFPLHILQAPRGQLRLAARAKGDMAELARIEAEPLGELPEVYRKQPIYYFTNRFSVRGTNTTVKWPRYSQVMDYELEFGIVTKNKGANISAAKARDHIFGYTIFNDFSARDAQRIEMEGRLGPAKGKSFDGGNVMGPWIVTPDEIGDPYKLKMEARVNGERRSQGVTEGMLFSFEEIIAHVSKDETLMPGEFIGSGTVGNGCGLELGWYLEHGDTIELEVEKIGTLKNRVERRDR